MEEKKERFTYLFTRYSAKTATPQEVDEFSKMVDQSMSDAELSMYLNQLWENMPTAPPLFSAEKSEQMLNQILQVHTEEVSPATATQKITSQLWIKIAAVISIIVAVSFLGRSLLAPKAQKIVKTTVQHDVLPGGNKAILKLANGKTFRLDNSPNGILTNQGALKITKLANGQLMCKVSEAAGTASSTANNLISTPRGGQYQIILADGTKVWLNAASSLSFPGAFTGKTRNVSVTGEAYFEVHKNPAMPFIVNTGTEEIEVLGTHFNVSCYPEENLSKTTLLEGSVKINSHGASHLLKPGQQAVCTADGQTSISRISDPSTEIAWKNGEFIFNDASIKQVMLQIARWYDVRVVYEGKMSTHQLTGSISRNVNASELLGMLSYTGIQFKIEGKKITIIN